MTLKNAVTKGVKAWRGRRVGYWLCIDPKTGEYYLPTSAALAELVGVGSMPRRWLLHSPDPGWPRHHRKGRKRGFRRRVVVRVHKATESIEMYFGMERNGLISALEVGGDHFEAGLEYYRRETRPATEAEEKEAVTYLRQRNYTHFKLSKRCALKR